MVIERKHGQTKVRMNTKQKGMLFMCAMHELQNADT